MKRILYSFRELQCSINRLRVSVRGSRFMDAERRIAHKREHIGTFYLVSELFDGGVIDAMVGED